MTAPGPVPLARRMLLHKKSRLALSIAGVAFSVLVMFMQIGFITGFTASQTNLLPHLQGDLVMINRQRETLSRVARTFDLVRLQQARQLADVAEVVPLYENVVRIKNPDTKRIRLIHTLAFPAGSGAFELPAGEAAALHRAGAVLWDEAARPLFGKVSVGTEMELGAGNVRVAGEYHLGPSVSRDGLVLMSDGTWAGLGGNLAKPNLGLIRLRPGADSAAVRAKLLTLLPDDIALFDRAALSQREDRYSIFETAVGVIFGSGLVIGFVIGVVICYQILFNEVLDHLPQYATIKAIGFANRYLVALVMKESGYLAVFGFVPGLLASWALYRYFDATSGLAMMLTPGRIVTVFVLTLPMCCIAGMLALRRVLQTDPAEVF